MQQPIEPTRLQIDLRLYLGEETRLHHGAIASAWTTATPSWWAPTSGVLSNAAVADCTCPTDCIRDHENE
ncbi:MAG: hypothetical protein AB1627_00170 [Chloroflexota bacterium]